MTFVIALPLLLLFLFAVVDLGRAVFLSMALDDAAHAVCRVACEHPAEGVSQSLARESAYAASPALEAGGLRLGASIRYGELEDRAYVHRFYDDVAGSFEERPSKTSSRSVEVSLDLEGDYLTPLGEVLSRADGGGDGRFSFHARARGVADATVEGGAW